MMTDEQVKEWMRWAFRARWYLESNCAGQDGAERLMGQLDALVETQGLEKLVKDLEHFQSE
jgi:hypothetical protein